MDIPYMKYSAKLHLFDLSWICCTTSCSILWNVADLLDSFSICCRLVVSDDLLHNISICRDVVNFLYSLYKEMEFDLYSAITALTS